MDVDELLHTAVEATYRNKGVTLNDRTIELIVQHSGEGIAAEHLPQILERIYRGDSSGTRPGRKRNRPDHLQGRRRSPRRPDHRPQRRPRRRRDSPSNPDGWPGFFLTAIAYTVMMMLVMRGMDHANRR